MNIQSAHALFYSEAYENKIFIEYKEFNSKYIQVYQEEPNDWIIRYKIINDDTLSLVGFDEALCDHMEIDFDLEPYSYLKTTDDNLKEKIETLFIHIMNVAYAA